MSVIIGAGWRLVHLADRVIELRKESFEHRMVHGRDGFVRFRAEPGMDRKLMIDRAIEIAKASDAKVAEMIASQYAPITARYRMRQRQFARVFGTPEDPEIIGRKRP